MKVRLEKRKESNLVIKIGFLKRNKIAKSIGNKGKKEKILLNKQ